MKRPPIALGLCLVLTTAGCGGASSDGAASTATASTTAASTSSSASLKAVPHEKLTELLPTIPGWKRESEPRGDTDTTVNVSRVQVDYVQEGSSGAGLSIEMMDMASNSGMLALIRESLKRQGTWKTADGSTQKSLTVADYPATEEWTPGAGNGTVSVLLSDRFVVTVTGSTVGNVGVIHKVFESIDLKKIASLK